MDSNMLHSDYCTGDYGYHRWPGGRRGAQDRRRWVSCPRSWAARSAASRGGQILGSLLGGAAGAAAATRRRRWAALLGDAVGGVGGGAILTAIVGAVMNAMKKAERFDRTALRAARRPPVFVCGRATSCASTDAVVDAGRVASYIRARNSRKDDHGSAQRRHRAGHAVPAELHDPVRHGRQDTAWSSIRAATSTRSWRSLQGQCDHRRRDLDHAWPYRPCRRRHGTEGGARRRDHRPA